MKKGQKDTAGRLRAAICAACSLVLATALLPVSPAMARQTESAVGNDAAQELAASISGQLAEQREVMAQAQAAGKDPRRALIAHNAQKRRSLKTPSANSTSPTSKARKKATAQLPNEYYLTNLGLVTDVKDQSPWGACWAFGNIAALESAVLRAQGTQAADADMSEPKLTDLPSSANDSTVPDYSERHLTYFANQTQTAETAGNQAGEGVSAIGTSGPNAAFDAGGYDQLAEALFTAQQGIVSESDTPYTSQAGNRSPNESWAPQDDTHRLDTGGIVITDMDYLDSPAMYDPETETYIGYDPNATETIKEALVNKSAVAMGIQADQSMPQQTNTAFSSEYLSRDNWCQYNGEKKIDPNHEVTIVGWDDSYPASNFTGRKGGSPAEDAETYKYTNGGNGAWLVKNSWGTKDWGIEDSDGNHTGFFWVSYYDHSIESLVAYSVASKEQSYDNVHQYDYLSVAGGPVMALQDVMVANIFIAGEDDAAPNGTGTGTDEVLEAVSARPTYASTSDIYIAIYLMDPEDQNPTDGTLVHEQTAREVACGFHIIPLDKPITLQQGQRYAVVERASFTDSEDNETYNDIMLELADNSNNSGSAFQFTALSHEGETRVCTSGGWVGVAAFNSALEQNSYDEVGNALIKVYTNNAADPEPDPPGTDPDPDPSGADPDPEPETEPDSPATDPEPDSPTTSPVSLAKASVSAPDKTWTGKALAPAVTVALNGKTLKSGSDYSVSYSGNSNVGMATVTVTGKGSYTGTAKGSFRILPKGTSLKKLKKAKKGFTATWAKQASQTTGYELRYSTKKNMKDAKVKAVKKAKATTLKVKKLKAKKRYYVQVRTYKAIGATKYYSAWSKAKSVKVK